MSKQKFPLLYHIGWFFDRSPIPRVGQILCDKVSLSAGLDWVISVNIITKISENGRVCDTDVINFEHLRVCEWRSRHTNIVSFDKSELTKDQLNTLLEKYKIGYNYDERCNS